MIESLCDWLIYLKLWKGESEMEQINDKVTNVFVAKNEEELKKAFISTFIVNAYSFITDIIFPNRPFATLPYSFS